MLGRWVSVPFAEEFGVPALRPNADRRADRRAEADADKDETRLAGIKASIPLKDDRNDAEQAVAARGGRGKEEVRSSSFGAGGGQRKVHEQQAIDDLQEIRTRQLEAQSREGSCRKTHGKVNRDSDHDRLDDKHHERSSQRASDDTVEREVGALELCVLVAVFLWILFAHPLGALLEEDRVIRLGEEDRHLRCGNLVSMREAEQAKSVESLPGPSSRDPRTRSIRRSSATGDSDS